MKQFQLLVQNLICIGILLSQAPSARALPTKQNLKSETSKFVSNREVIERKVRLILDFSNITEKPQWLSLDKKSATKSAPVKLLLQMTARFADDSTARKLSEIITAKELESAGIEEFLVKNTDSGVVFTVHAANSVVPVQVGAEELKSSADAFLASYRSHRSLEDGSAAHVTSLLERRLLSKTYSQESLSTRVNRIASMCLGSRRVNGLNGEPEILKSILASLGVDTESQPKKQNVPVPAIRKLDSGNANNASSPSPISNLNASISGPQTNINFGGGGASGVTIPTIVSGHKKADTSFVPVPQPRKGSSFQPELMTVVPSVPKIIAKTDKTTESVKQTNVSQQPADFRPYIEDLEFRLRRYARRITENRPVVYGPQLNLEIHKDGQLRACKVTSFAPLQSQTDWGVRVVNETCPFRPLPEGSPEAICVRCSFNDPENPRVELVSVHGELSNRGLSIVSPSSSKSAPVYQGLSSENSNPDSSVSISTYGYGLGTKKISDEITQEDISTFREALRSIKGGVRF